MTETVAPFPVVMDSDNRQSLKQTSDNLSPVGFSDSVDFVDPVDFVALATGWSVLDSLDHRQAKLSFTALMADFLTQRRAYIAGRNKEFFCRSYPSVDDPQYCAQNSKNPVADSDSVDLFGEITPKIEVPGHTLDPGAYYWTETSTYNSYMQSRGDSLAAKTTVFFAPEQLEANFDFASRPNSNCNNIITRFLRTQEKRAHEPYSTTEP